MDKAPEVSIIIAAYNVERYIERAIASALNQQDITLEVMVVDDCSTDNTWSIVSQHTDPRVKCLKLDSNGGPGAARNAGIAQASGTWIAILDGDDAFAPDRLARCLMLAKAHHADIIVDNIEVHREMDNKTFPMFPPTVFSRLQTLDLTTFIQGTLPGFSHYTLGYLKPVFLAEFSQKHALSYDTSLNIGEDYLLMAEALANGANCIVEHGVGYYYTARKGSISHRLSLADITGMLTTDAAFTTRYKLSQTEAIAQKNREANLKKEYAFTLLVEALKQKNVGGALKAVATCPACIWLLHRPISVRLMRILHCVRRTGGQ